MHVIIRLVTIICHSDRHQHHLIVIIIAGSMFTHQRSSSRCPTSSSSSTRGPCAPPMEDREVAGAEGVLPFLHLLEMFGSDCEESQKKTQGREVFYCHTI